MYYGPRRTALARTRYRRPPTRGPDPRRRSGVTPVPLIGRPTLAILASDRVPCARGRGEASVHRDPTGNTAVRTDCVRRGPGGDPAGRPRGVPGDGVVRAHAPVRPRHHADDWHDGDDVHVLGQVP